jgi:hypothetical protein
MPYDIDELREKIPLYLKGGLTQSEKREFEEAIQKFPGLKDEIEEFTEFHEVYREIEKEIPPPSLNLYERISDNIRAEKKTEAAPEKRFAGKFQDLLKGFFWSPRVSWAVVSVQIVLIIILLFSLPRDDKYETLTSKTEGIRVNVVFKENTVEKEMRALIHKIGGSIVSGPSSTGLYVIEIKNRDIQIVIATLRDSNIVGFAEKSY